MIAIIVQTCINELTDTQKEPYVVKYLKLLRFRNFYIVLLSMVQTK